MDFVDEQHIAFFEIGQQRREIAGLRDHRAGRRAEADAQFARHDLRQRGLAEAGRADEQHMIERLAALARGIDEDLRDWRAPAPARRIPTGSADAAKCRQYRRRVARA
jgi:hypothetical protein